MSNCDRHCCGGPFDTYGATLEHLPWSEKASLRQTITHKTLQMARTGAWLSSSLRVKKEES